MAFSHFRDIFTHLDNVFSRQDNTTSITKRCVHSRRVVVLNQHPELYGCKRFACRQNTEYYDKQNHSTKRKSILYAEALIARCFFLFMIAELCKIDSLPVIKIIEDDQHQQRRRL